MSDSSNPSKIFCHYHNRLETNSFNFGINICNDGYNELMQKNRCLEEESQQWFNKYKEMLWALMVSMINSQDKLELTPDLMNDIIDNYTIDIYRALDRETIVIKLRRKDLEDK